MHWAANTVHVPGWRACPPAWPHRCSRSSMRLHSLQPARQAAWHAAISAVAVVCMTSCWQRHKPLVPCASAQTRSLPQLMLQLRMGVPHGFTEPCIYSLHSSHVAHELTHCMSENDVVTAGIQDCCPDHTSARFGDGRAVSWPNAAAGEEQRFGAHRMHACSHTCGRLR